MKKILSILFLYFCFLNAGYCTDYSTYCAANEPKKTFGGTLASLTGKNLLTKEVAESQIAKALKKELNSDFKIDIDSFYGVNFLDGEFKGLKASAKSIVYDGFFLSDLEVSTLCNYHHVSFNDGKIKFLENMVLKYSTKITPDDLKNTVNSTAYKKILENMNKDKMVSSLFKIDASDIKIINNKISLNYTVQPLPSLNAKVLKKFIQPINLNILGDLTVKDGEVKLCNLELNSKKIGDIPPYIIDLLDPLSYDVNISKDSRGELKVENVKIENNKIAIDGAILIFKE